MEGRCGGSGEGEEQCAFVDDWIGYGIRMCFKWYSEFVILALQIVALF